MKKVIKVIFAVLAVSMIFALTVIPSFADEVADTVIAEETTTAVAETEEVAASSSNAKAYAAAILVAVVATAGAIGMAIAIKSGSDGIARQPEAAGNIRTNVMLGLVFIETAIIYALIVAILVIFVL